MRTPITLQRQRGFSLAIVLFLLTTMTLIGVSTMRQAQLEVQTSAAVSRYHHVFSMALGAAQMAIPYLGYKTPIYDEQRPDKTGGTFAAGDLPTEYFSILTNGTEKAQPQLTYQGFNPHPPPGWMLNSPTQLSLVRYYYDAAGKGFIDADGNDTADPEESKTTIKQLILKVVRS
jgi:hypothetical protein